jgi:hypothetical protein
MIIVRKQLSRRTVLRGFGVSLALPLLDAMVPALTPLRRTAASARTRFTAIEMVHGAAGSTDIGRANHYWSPIEEGADFRFTPTLQSLEPLRPYVTIISNTDLQNAMSLSPAESGDMADHARSSAAFLTAAHPKMTAGSDIESGPSIDQLYAQRVGRETRVPSMQLCIEDPQTLVGDCGHDYSCAYSHTISWASPTQPLPMEWNPRAVFDRLFGESARDAASAGTRKSRSDSILDETVEYVVTFLKGLGLADQARVRAWLEEVRAIERRIQRIERQHRDTNGSPRPLTDAPIGVPDSFDEHVRLMFDLQLLAFKADITRVFSFKLGADRSQRVYPESGVTIPFHTLSHHRETPEKIEEFAKLNQYHVSKVASFLDRLRQTPDGDGTLLDHAVVLYGSPMGDSHVHEHKFLPLFLAGHASGALKGQQHLRCAPGTPMANVLLTLAHKLGVDVERIGDSTGEVAI